MIWIPVALAGLALLWLLLRHGRGGRQDGGHGPYGGNDGNVSDTGSFVTPFPFTSSDTVGYGAETAPDSNICDPGSGGWDSGGFNDSGSCDSGGGDSGGGDSGGGGGGGD
jgi:hypothetical protein